MAIGFLRATAISLVCGLGVSLASAQSLTTAFTYQGELASSGTPTTGVYDMQFRLLDADGNQVGATLCSDNVTVTEGRFNVLLDFGPVFSGQRRLLEIAVRPDMGRCSLPLGYTVLTPQQELTAAPNASFALTAGSAANATTLNGQTAGYYQNAANLTGTIADARLTNNVARLNSNQTFTGVLNFTNQANTFNGIFSGSGQGLTNLNGASINAGTVSRSSLSADVQSVLGTLGSELVIAGTTATALNPGFVTVSGSYAYVLNGSTSMLQVFNMSNPAAPALVGAVATDGYPTSVVVSGAYAYVVNYGASTLQIFNISNPASPVLAGGISTAPSNGLSPISIAVSGSYAYVLTIYSNKLQVFNISNPAAPVLAASVGTGNNSYSLAVSGSYAYVLNDYTNSMQVFNITNPAAPTLAGSVATGGNPRSVAIAGSYAYVANYTSNTLQVFNLSNPAAPALAGSIGTGNYPTSVAVSGSYAYVANNGSNTLQVFNISAPASPSLAGNLATDSSPISVAVSGQYACVVNFGSSTLQTATFASRLVFPSTLARASLAGADGSGLLKLSAANLTGSIPVARLTNVPADSLTGSIPLGVVIPAESLVGNIPSASLTSVPAASLTGSVPASSLTNVPAASLTGGVPFQALPATSWDALNLGSNAISGAAFSTVSGTSQPISTRSGTAVVNWSTTASSTAGSQFVIRVRASTNGVSRYGAQSYFLFNQSNVRSTISGNAIVDIPSTGVTTFMLEVKRVAGTGSYQTDFNDSLTGTVLNIGD